MSDNNENGIPGQVAPQPSNKKPIVVGLYGVPGSGKSHLLNRLKKKLGKDNSENFAFYDGSEVINSVVPGGLTAFKKSDETKKQQWRRAAIEQISKKCTESGKAGIVAGHFMFWKEGQSKGHTVCTQYDLETYTHILYLDIPAEIVAQRVRDDKTRSRENVSVDHTEKWQNAEKTELQRACLDHGILFSSSSRNSDLPYVSTLLQDFRNHNEEYNMSRATSRMDEVLAGKIQKVEAFLVMDADRTLTEVDTGKTFWEKASQGEGPLKELFSSEMGYSYTAFRQAVLLYEAVASNEEYDALCQEVASEVHMYPEFVSLLRCVATQDRIGAMVVTCGLRRVWDKILERENLSEKVSVLGGGRIANGFVVTASVKAAMVARLQTKHGTHVLAFGDSPLDLEMLRQANQAIVVTGKAESRSRMMDTALKQALNNGVKARQAVLPNDATPRLDTSVPPLIKLQQPEFFHTVVRGLPLQVMHATGKNAAKLMMAPMRDAALAGPVLRKAHQHVGWYLATQYLTDLIGVEEYEIQHVQGHPTSDHRLSHEKQTSIVALMRGGEPMALAINDAFPLAMFLHANHPDDVKPHHLQDQRTVVLVDSVINSGKTVVDFVKRIRDLHPTIRIVVVAGVVQKQSVSGEPGKHGKLQSLGGHISVVALRQSDNKFTGTGTNDTGNRLYNTTHLA